MNKINLHNRYGYNIYLEHLEDSKWLLKIDEKANYTRVGGGLPKNIKFVDPEGGPFLSVEGTVEGKVITKIEATLDRKQSVIIDTGQKVIEKIPYKDFIVTLEDREDETSRFKN